MAAVARTELAAELAAAGIQPRYVDLLLQLSGGQQEGLEALTMEQLVGAGGDQALPAPVARGLVRRLQDWRSQRREALEAREACRAQREAEAAALREMLAAAGVAPRYAALLASLGDSDAHWQQRLPRLTAEQLVGQVDDEGVAITAPVSRGLVRKLQSLAAGPAACSCAAAVSTGPPCPGQAAAAKGSSCGGTPRATVPMPSPAEEEQRREFLRKLQACDEAEEARLEAKRLEQERAEAEAEERRRRDEERRRVEEERRAAHTTMRDSDHFGDTPVCMLSLRGCCPETSASSCAHGRHLDSRLMVAEVQDDEEVLVNIAEAKMRLLQAQWTDMGGSGDLVCAWQVRNRWLEWLFRATAHNLTCELGRMSDALDAWHGTPEENILSIARRGFDAERRHGQAYGAGEYFAKDPRVSVGYAHGGSFMLLCRLLLGTEDVDHTWVSDRQYYVMKQRAGFLQALPLYVVQFQPTASLLQQQLMSLDLHEAEEEGSLKDKQRGARYACPARPEARMKGDQTQHLWIGWLAPELCRLEDEAVFKDVCEFCHDCDVAEVVPERNGARIGAHVRLATPINRRQYNALVVRRYRGSLRVSVDDEPPGYRAKRLCPRLGGVGRYCRSWNIRGHHRWNWGCPFEHPLEARPTHNTQYKLEPVGPGTAKFDEIRTALTQSAPFHDGNPRLVAVSRVVNRELEQMYERRRSFLAAKHGSSLEKELWHGTNCNALSDLLTHGLQPPADSNPGEACPVSGGKGLCTTLCGNDCPHCVHPHVWERCHMFGSGIYLADLAQKGHRYVREPEHAACIRGLGGRLWGCVVGEDDEAWHLDSGRPAAKEEEGGSWYWDASEGTTRLHKMLLCRVCLGSPYLIEGNLRKPDAMHDFYWCQDPRKHLETAVQEWNHAQSHDTFYVRGLAGAHRKGLGVYNSEYIVFHPFQVLPLYVVSYVME